MNHQLQNRKETNNQQHEKEHMNTKREERNVNTTSILRLREGRADDGDKAVLQVSAVAENRVHIGGLLVDKQLAVAVHTHILVETVQELSQSMKA